MAKRRQVLHVNPDIETEEDGMMATLDQIFSKVDATIAYWNPQPTEDERKSFIICGLYILDETLWSPSNDLVATRLLAVSVGWKYLAHPDGVYNYRQGAFSRVEELTECAMRHCVKILMQAAKIFRFAMCDAVPRRWDEAVDAVRGLATQCATEQPVTTLDFVPPKGGGKGRPQPASSAWALDGGKGVQSLVNRFTGGEDGATLVNLFGKWMNKPRPSAHKGHCSLVRIVAGKWTMQPAGASRIKQIGKHPSHCYFFIPIEMGATAPDWVHEELRPRLCTSYAVNDAGREIDQCLEALAWMDQIAPPIEVEYTGNGGNAKSARTVLRNNVFSGHHKIIPPEVFQKPDEFRIQGTHFAFAKAATVQERQPGLPLLEDLWKRYISGERLACRFLFGKSTTLYQWLRCIKFREFNKGSPSIKGDPARLDLLRAFIRRVVVIELTATFSSDPDKVSIEDGVFEECSYIQDVIIPTIQGYTAEMCRPPESVKENGRRFVAQMANGGIDPPAHMISVGDERKRLESAKADLRNLHAETVGHRVIKTYNLGYYKSLPGVFKKGSKKKSKLEHFEEYQTYWSHWFHVEGTDILLAKYESGIQKHGQGSFYTHPEEARNMWACKEEAMSVFTSDSDISSFHVAHIQTSHLVLGDMHAGAITEKLNLVALENCLDDMPENDKKAYVRSVVRRYRAGRREGDFCSIDISYYRKGNILGRRYALGPSAQGLPSSMRNACLQVDHAPSGMVDDFVFFDIDVENCFPSLLYAKLKQRGHHMEEDFPVFTAFKHNPKAWRSFLSEYFDIEEKRSKKMLIRFLHLAEPSSEMPLLWELSADIKRAVEHLLSMTEYEYLKGLFEDRRIPFATRLHYALSSIEDSIITRIEEAMATRLPSARINTYMFDVGALYGVAFKVVQY